ncbi:hypothetical protein [Spiroplasma alleghenense]|uniref:Uncharacterized protein n=1 Tax=Spiroplasma alleghenense TaxID=216931 RepID=A0A345Z467_9MOLU|nr:hypothetical protein [Spiroplasma alleghenense]AXK51396.1 hypothetical protein SALLE_v1c07260 [Spiroplasma alleghenense]
MFRQNKKNLIFLLIFSLTTVSLSSLAYGIVKQYFYNKIDFKSEVIKDLNPQQTNDITPAKTNETRILGLPAENLKFSVNEVLNFTSIKQDRNLYYYYFNLEFFKYSFIKKWLYLIPVPINSRLFFKVNDKKTPTEIEVIYGTNEQFIYHWFYKVKNFK